MSVRPTIDSLRFARSGESLAGEVPLVAMPRLLESLAAAEGCAHYRIYGKTLAGRAALGVEIDAVTRLVCQHCLEPYAQSLRIRVVLPVARDEQELAQWERDDPLLDALVAEPALDALTLVEDEILLALPIAPRHPDGACVLGGT